MTAQWTLRDAHRFDVVFANRDIVPEARIRLPEQKLFSRGARLSDFDDAIHLGRRQGKVAWILKNAAFATPGNEELAEFARQHSNRVQVLPTVVNTDVYVPSSERVRGPSESDGRDRIRQIGTVCLC